MNCNLFLFIIFLFYSLELYNGQKAITCPNSCPYVKAATGLNSTCCGVGYVAGCGECSGQQCSSNGLSDCTTCTTTNCNYQLAYYACTSNQCWGLLTGTCKC